MCLFAVFTANEAFGQLPESTVDPRLIELVETVKKRASENRPFEKIPAQVLSTDEIYFDRIDQMHSAFYSRNSKKIIQSVEKFQEEYDGKSPLSLDRVPQVYNIYANLLDERARPSVIRDSLVDFSSEGNWFERHIALSVLAYSHASAQERQAALQKAQLALSTIPSKPDPENLAYVEYAKIRTTSLIAHLHNLQGNSDLALSVSLDYLRLTETKPDPKTEVDLLNNLIYAYSLSRNEEAQLYLSQQLLEIEKSQSSSVAGLSEMRIAGVMNSSGRYEEGMSYAKLSLKKAANPRVIQIARVNEAIALAGLGRLEEARRIAKLAEVNLNQNHMLTSETGKSDLYLAFLLAQAEDNEYATQLYNRQLDVKAQKFYANNSRDTTAMLAELENSHERQIEREAAAARESELQALTIKRHRNLNRALIVLSFLMAIALVSAFMFVRYRGKVLRKLEIKTREAASAEKLKSEFLGMISHELRTPLNGIIGISDYLTNHHADQDIREKTSIILRSGNELLSVVKSLTDMARIDAGQLELLTDDTDLGESLASVPPQWREAARAKGLIFTSFIDPGISKYHVDEDRILQCINILMANAISFTESGRVHLHVTASKTEPMALTAIVADTGQGMSELVQSRLFTPFMQADASLKRNHMGTGLSLAIAYALTDMMGGQLTVFSREGRGSEFKFTVPLKPVSRENLPDVANTQVDSSDIKSLDGLESKSPPTRETTPDTVAAEKLDYVEPMLPADSRELGLYRAEDKPDHDAEETGEEESNVEALPTGTQFQSPLRILIVDDIPSNRDILRVLLERKGHTCREAAEGLTALKSLDRNPCDIVIMDIHMPLMDGVEATRRIRRSGRSYENIPIIALTADNSPTLNAEMMEAGANLFLTKPVTQAGLFRSIDQLRKPENIRILSRSA